MRHLKWLLPFLPLLVPLLLGIAFVLTKGGTR